MKQAVTAIMAALVLLAWQAPPRAGEEKAAKGWSEAEMEEAADGCTLTMVTPNVESYRRRGALRRGAGFGGGTRLGTQIHDRVGPPLLPVHFF